MVASIREALQPRYPISTSSPPTEPQISHESFLAQDSFQFSCANYQCWILCICCRSKIPKEGVCLQVTARRDMKSVSFCSTTCTNKILDPQSANIVWCYPAASA
jgi:hypothetical protein